MKHEIIDQFIQEVTEKAKQDFFANGPSEPKVFQLIKTDRLDFKWNEIYLNNPFEDHYPERLEKIEDLVEHFHRDKSGELLENICTIYYEWMGSDTKEFLLFQIRKPNKKSQQLFVVERKGITVNESGQIIQSNMVESYCTEDIDADQ